MADGRKANIFGIRHLSPAGAFYVRAYFDRVKPQLILIEGPSDFNEMLPSLVDPQVKPPMAIMAYTKEAPIRTILFPFAVYSPEYQAALWAKEHHCACRFMDLPSGVMLALKEEQEPDGGSPNSGSLDREENAGRQAANEESAGRQAANEESADRQAADGESADRQAEENKGFSLGDVYEQLDRLSGEDSHETFWEHVPEHAADEEGYRKGASLFGENIRLLTEAGDEKRAGLDRLREAYMCRVLDQAADSGIPMGKIAVVTGAYHVKGLQEGKAMEDQEAERLPCKESMITMMPYSYYRLSMRSGYGAGNGAPAYYELLWESLREGRPERAVYEYLSRVAKALRKFGSPVSSASVIEAVRLSGALAQLHGYQIPSLKDLRDGAVACMGHGQFSEIAVGVADTEMGTKIGSLPEGMSQTSIQTDFYQKLEELRLSKYKSMLVQDLQLDLRENLKVKSKKSAFMDLERSFFLHQLRILAIPFARQEQISQEKATWAEFWHLQWTPEAEIQLVESVLKGDTVRQAASFVLKEEAEKLLWDAGSSRIRQEDAPGAGGGSRVHPGAGPDGGKPFPVDQLWRYPAFGNISSDPYIGAAFSPCLPDSSGKLCL